LQLPLFHIRVYTVHNRVFFFAIESETRSVFDDIEGKPVFDWYIQNTPAEGFSEVELKKLFYKQRNETKLELNDNVIQRIARDHNVYYLNKHDYLCDDLGQTCDGITPEGYKAFWDYGHFTIEGAKHFGKKIHQLNWLNRFQK